MGRALFALQKTCEACGATGAKKEKHFSWQCQWAAPFRNVRLAVGQWSCRGSPPCVVSCKRPEHTPSTFKEAGLPNCETVGTARRAAWQGICSLALAARGLWHQPLDLQSSLCLACLELPTGFPALSTVGMCSAWGCPSDELGCCSLLGIRCGIWP